MEEEEGNHQEYGGAAAQQCQGHRHGLDFVFHLIDMVTLTILSLIDNGVSYFACGTDVRGRRESNNASSLVIIASLYRAPISKKGSGFQEEEDTNARRIALTPSETHHPNIF